jgi:hypothetical protein
MFKKLIKSLPVLVFFLAFAGIVRANGLLVVKSIDMPGYVNWEPFDISYTALQADGNAVEVTGYIKKDGGDWKEAGTSNKFADSFKIDSSFLSGDGVYKIHFSAKSGAETADSGEESFNVDFTAPDPVSDYRKERKDAFVYKICWKNPDDDDFNRTIIYRSDKKEFTTDSSTQITEVGGAKNEEKCFEDNIPENKDYYYVTRTVDNAGNASSVVGDSEVTATTTTNVLGVNVTPTPTTGGLPLAKVSPQPTSEVEEGQILGGETSKAAESKPSVIQSLNATIVKFGFWKIIGIIVIVLGIVILLVSLFKKRR